MTDKLTANNFDPKKGYVFDPRGEKLKITQDGKTAEFSDYETFKSSLENQ